MLTSSSSGVSRTSTSPADAPVGVRTAPVVHLAERRPRRAPVDDSRLRVTPELLAALGGPWAALRRHL